MKLIIIHGPPAAGKLTISNALARRTGFKVFHNHLSIDCTQPVFEFGTDAFWDINITVRCEVIAEAVRQNIDLIHTFCYAKGPDDERFLDLVAAAQDNGGDVNCVLVYCRDEVRKERIINESRSRMRKLTDPDTVDNNRLKKKLKSPHPDYEAETLVIDTSDIAPEESAAMIIERFGLNEIEKEGI